MATEQECSDQNIFKEMRTKLDQKFSEFDRQLVEQRKKLELKIDQLELEFTNKQKQIESDKQTLTELYEQTQNKLGQNSLMDLQVKILNEINEKLKNLNSEYTKQSQLRFKLYWNNDDMSTLVNNIDLELTPLTVPDETEPQEKNKDTIPRSATFDADYTDTSDREYSDTFSPPDNQSIPHATEGPAYYDSYSSWNGHYRDKRGGRGGRRRDKYAY